MFFNIFRVRVEGSMRFVLFDKINVKKDLSKKKNKKSDYFIEINTIN